MSDITYPYMPSDRHLKYVVHDHPHMLEAARARDECAGDPLWPVGIVAVRGDEVVARAGNGFNRRTQERHICPRIVFECKSGEGYDLCSLHDSAGHSEPMVVKACQEAGIDTHGLDAYLYGHWWACEPCWQALIEADFRDLYVTDDAHERFTKEKVYSETLKPRVKSAYISGPLTYLSDHEHVFMRALYERLAAACAEMGCTPYVPHQHCDPLDAPHWKPSEVWSNDFTQVREADVIVAEVTHPSLGVGGELAYADVAGKPIVLLSRKGIAVSRFVRGIPSVVYHVEYETPEQACRRVQNVLRQM